MNKGVCATWFSRNTKVFLKQLGRAEGFGRLFTGHHTIAIFLYSFCNFTTLAATPPMTIHLYRHEVMQCVCVFLQTLHCIAREDILQGEKGLSFAG